MPDKIDISPSTKTTESLWSVHKTFDNQKSIEEHFLNLHNSENKEEKRFLDSLTYGLKDIKDSAALTAAIKKTLETKAVIKDSWKEQYNGIEFATADGPFNIHIHQDQLWTRYNAIAKFKLKTVEDYHYEELKEEKLKDKPDDKELTENEAKKLRDQADEKFEIGDVTLERKAVEPVAKIESAAPKLMEDPAWFVEHRFGKIENLMDVRGWNAEKWIASIGDRFGKLFSRVGKKKAKDIAQVWKEVVEEVVEKVAD